MKLSILIPSLPMRVGNFLSRVVEELDYQIQELERDDVELLVFIENKGQSIGEKRNDLIRLSTGGFITFVDDDDRVGEDYVSSIIEAIDEHSEADCIVFDSFCTVSNSMDGSVASYSFLCKYGVEFEPKGHTDNAPWYGKPAHTMVWNSKIMRDHKFPDLIRKEDVVWVESAWRDIKEQVRIDKTLYFYDYDAATSQSLDYQYVKSERRYMTRDDRKKYNVKAYKKGKRMVQKERQQVVQWWIDRHKTADVHYLSGSNPKGVWERLNINDTITKGGCALVVGIGLGLEVKDLCTRGLDVHVLDICPEAFEVVKEYASGFYLADDLSKIPRDTFDFAVSHLVAQHMTDYDLQWQIAAVLRGLKPDRLFAMQFANNTSREPDSILNCDRGVFFHVNSQMKGGVVRSCREMSYIVNRAGGEIVWYSKPWPCGTSNTATWYCVHIRERRKDNSDDLSCNGVS